MQLIGLHCNDTTNFHFERLGLFRRIPRYTVISRYRKWTFSTCRRIRSTLTAYGPVRGCTSYRPLALRWAVPRTYLFIFRWVVPRTELFQIPPVPRIVYNFNTEQKFNRCSPSLKLDDRFQILMLIVYFHLLLNLGSNCLKKSWIQPIGFKNVQIFWNNNFGSGVNSIDSLWNKSKSFDRIYKLISS